MNKKGFTLLELMVSVGIFAVVAAMGSRMFITILRTNTKSRVAREAKQGGSYVVEVMETTMRNARKIMENYYGQTCEENMSRLNIKMPDGGEVEFACLDTDGDAKEGRIASNSARLTPSNFRTTACRFDCRSIGGYQKITFAFTLSNSSVASSPEETVTEDFSAVVSLRNY